MATKKNAASTMARVLVNGHYGQPDDVVELSADDLATAMKSGQVDPHPDAVAYASSLKVAAPRPQE